MNHTEAQKTARHTPGPWIISETGIKIIGSGSTHIADCSYPYQYPRAPKSFTESYANSALIASAPDMLLALRELLAIGEGGVIQRNETGKPTWSAMDEIKRIAGAAIAKAEGGA